jgi:hypothetical protein
MKLQGQVGSGPALEAFSLCAYLKMPCTGACGVPVQGSSREWFTAILPRAKSSYVAASCLVKTGWRVELPVFFEKARYFSEVLIDVNLVFSLPPIPFTTAMIASEIPAAINPYSIAVAPVSSVQNFRANAIIRGRCARTSEPPVNIDRESTRSPAI